MGHRISTPPSAEKTACPICNKEFSSPGNMKLHVDNIHSERPIEEWVECEVCKTKLKTRHLLLKHLIRKHQIYQRKVMAPPPPPLPTLYQDENI